MTYPRTENLNKIKKKTIKINKINFMCFLQKKIKWFLCIFEKNLKKNLQ